MRPLVGLVQAAAAFAAPGSAVDSARAAGTGFDLLARLAPHGVAEWMLVGIALSSGVTLLLMELAQRLQTTTGLSSDARIVASDTGQQRVQKLWDDATGLCGQPDYVITEMAGRHERLVPVEVKPTRKSARLYESDEMQLVVYLLLLRRAYGERAASYGYVRYAAHTFTVDLTEERTTRCLYYASEVRAARHAAVVHRNHRIKGRCVGCSMRLKCNESLSPETTGGATPVVVRRSGRRGGRSGGGRGGARPMSADASPSRQPPVSPER
jgi:CRISPR-associated exonuclease Cas4